MTDRQTQERADESNTIKDPDDWTTGDERMTGAQRSYLKTLSEEAKEPFDDKLSKAEASKRIDELQKQTGRGGNEGASHPTTEASAGGEAGEESESDANAE